MIAYFVFFCLGCAIYGFLKLIRHFEHDNLAASKIGAVNPATPLNTAVVLGGSISGLLTAKCLSNHSKKVILVERKQMRDSDNSVAAHGNFVHILLTRGCSIIKRLFPGIEEQLSPENNKDVFAVDFGSDLFWQAEGNRLRVVPKGTSITATQIQRFLLENLLRERVLKTQNIEVMDETKFESYAQTATGRINGIVVSKEGVTLPNGGKIEADLVIDCMGLLSPTADMLSKANAAQIESTKIKSDLQYVSQLYKQPEGLSYTTIYYQPHAPNNTMGVIVLPYTKGVSVLTFVGYNKAKLPRTQQEVNEALEQFPVAQEYLAKCTPITDTSSYKKEGTELRHFEKVQLDGFIALGDAMCNFNPVFGQGQTSAADQVLALDNMLRQLKAGERLNCQAFQARAKAIISMPFALAAFSDLRYPKTTTNAPILKRLAPFIAYPLKKLLLDASKHDWSYRCFIQVLHMQQSYIWILLDPKLNWIILTKY